MKDLTLSANERLLIKYGFQDRCGEFTADARELIMLKLVRDNEAYLLKIAGKLEAEENKRSEIISLI
ncbi:MAG: hypothetical protein AAB706_02285 [Patescibacteria group bacterium]